MKKHEITHGFRAAVAVKTIAGAERGETRMMSYNAFQAVIYSRFGETKSQLLTAWGELNRAAGVAGAIVSRSDGCSDVAKSLRLRPV